MPKQTIQKHSLNNNKEITVLINLLNVKKTTCYYNNSDKS